MNPSEAHTYGKEPLAVDSEVHMAVIREQEKREEQLSETTTSIRIGKNQTIRVIRASKYRNTTPGQVTAVPPGGVVGPSTTGGPGVPEIGTTEQEVATTATGETRPTRKRRSPLKTRKSKPRTVVPPHSVILGAVQTLKQSTNKCILCDRVGTNNLNLVSFLDDRECVVDVFRRYGSVTLCEDDLVCSSCLSVANTITENIAAVRTLCKSAVDRHPVTHAGKRVHVEENFTEKLARNLTALLEQGRYCCTSLLHDSSQYNVHGPVLAAATNKLDEELEAGADIELRNVSDDGVKSLIQYMYTGKLVLSAATAAQLLPYFEQWELDWAAERCQEVVTAHGTKGRPKVRRGPRKAGVPPREGTVETVGVILKHEPAAEEEDEEGVEARMEVTDDEENNDPLPEDGAEMEEGEIASVMSLGPKRRRRQKIKFEIEDGVVKRRYTGPSKCPYCSKEYKRIYSMKEHVMRVHENRRPYVCEHCGNTYATKKELHMHMRIKHEDKIDPAEREKYSCALCGLTRGSVTQLNIHMARKHSDEKNVICETCGMGFKTKTNLSEHTRMMHDPRSVLHCEHPGCDRSFRGKFKLQEHMWRCHEQGEKRHKCKLCTYATHYSHSLRQHYSGKHSMRMSYLTKEWQAPQVKKRMFSEDAAEQSEMPPYTLEPLPGTAPLLHPGPAAVKVEVAHAAEGMATKYFPIEVQGEAGIKQSELLQSLVQNPEVNRLLFAEVEEPAQQQSLLRTWDGQSYIQQIAGGNIQYLTENILGAHDMVEDPGMEDVQVSVDVSGKREQEAAVALITVGENTEEVALQAGTVDPGQYQVHMESDNLYIVLPPSAKHGQ